MRPKKRFLVVELACLVALLAALGLRRGRRRRGKKGDGAQRGNRRTMSVPFLGQTPRASFLPAGAAPPAVGASMRLRAGTAPAPPPRSQGAREAARARRFAFAVARSHSEGALGALAQKKVSGAARSAMQRLTAETARRALGEADGRRLGRGVYREHAHCDSVERFMPSDAQPWDRLHVWLVNGQGLPWRPAYWPFEPRITVNVQGEDTGSSVECPIGAFEFRVRAPYMHPQSPAWDERGLLCYKRGGGEAFRVVVGAQGTLVSGLYAGAALYPRGLARYVLGRLIPLEAAPACEASFPLPEAGGDWADVRVPFVNGVIHLRVRVTAWEERPAREAARDLVDEVLYLKNGARAVVSSLEWPLDASSFDECAPADESRVALLWLPGRNDAFFHWHLLPLLQAARIDLFVLSYRRVGACVKYGFLGANPQLVSHCESGGFDEYHEEIDRALILIHHRAKRHGQTYRVLCYSHSTGSLILLDYLRARGDAAFVGFVFNSPFLGWGWDTTPLQRLLLRLLPQALVRLRVWSNETELSEAGGPCAWALQFFSQFAWDASRVLYNVPVTVGFCRGVNAALAALDKGQQAGVPITLEPFLVLTSKGDDVLHGDEMLRAAHAIGPSRTLLELTYARHDVFCSHDAHGVDAAVEYLRTWLVANAFAPRSRHKLSATPPVSRHPSHADLRHMQSFQSDDTDRMSSLGENSRVEF